MNSKKQYNKPQTTLIEISTDGSVMTSTSRIPVIDGGGGKFDTKETGSDWNNIWSE